MDKCMVCRNPLDGTIISPIQRHTCQHRRHNLFLSFLTLLDNHSDKKTTLDNFARNFCCLSCTELYTLGNPTISNALENEIRKAKNEMVDREQSTQIVTPRNQSFYGVSQTNPFSGTQIPMGTLISRSPYTRETCFAPLPIFRPSPFVGTVSQSSRLPLNGTIIPQTQTHLTNENRTGLIGLQGTIVPGTFCEPPTYPLPLPPFRQFPFVDTVSRPSRVPIDETIISETAETHTSLSNHVSNSISSNHTELTIFPPSPASAGYWPQAIWLPEIEIPQNILSRVPFPLQRKRIVGAFRIYEDLNGECSICLMSFHEPPSESRTVPIEFQPHRCKTSCQQNQKEHKIVSTICGHAFHEKCLITALETRNGCPRCRNDQIKMV